MSMPKPSQGFNTEPTDCQYSSENQRARLVTPSLPPMSSLLTTHEPLSPKSHRQQYEPLQHSPQKRDAHQHPSWLSDRDPRARPQQMYQAPENHDSHTRRYQAEPRLIQNANQEGGVSPVSYGVPLAQRRQVKRISQRRPGASKQREINRGPSPPISMRHDLQVDSYTQEQHRSPHQQQTPAPLEQTQLRQFSQRQGSQSMPISGLLSDGPSPAPQSVPTPTYTIRMRQEPMAARACGFGERDRRVIDPPPILQMNVESQSLSSEEISAMLKNPYAVVHCTLWDPVTDRDDTAMPGTTEKRQQRRLMGTLVASPFVGLDEFDVEGCFFTFPDLSVRTPGTYSLKFSLVILDPAQMFSGTSAPIRSSVKSNVFQVYNAKDFCGMRASTELTKKLKHQGCLISVKKGNAKSNGGTHARDDEEDEDMDDDVDEGPDGPGNSAKRGKKPKR